MKNGILQKKKIIKKIVLAFLSIFIVVQSYTTRVHALSNVITYNNYGSFEWSNVNFDLGIGNVNYGGCALTGNLNQYYTGTLRLNFSGYNSVQFGVMLSEGVYISNYGTNFIELTLQGVNYFQLGLVRTQANINALSFNSFSNWNLSAVGAYSEIQEVHRIKLDVGSILNAINGIKTDTSYLDDIYLQTTDINSDLESIKTQLYNIYQMQQYNIPFISQTAYWLIKRYGNYVLSDTFDDKGVFIQADFDKSVTDTFDGGKSIIIRAHKTVYLVYMVNWWREIFELATSEGVKQFTYNNATLMQNSTKLIVQGYTNNTNNDLYVSLTTYQNFTDINILPIYLGTFIPEEISYLTGIDINNTYTQQNKTIIDKLTELINKQTDIVINEEDKTEVNTNINNYNNVMTDINGIEIDFKNEFNTSNNNIQTQNLTPSQNLQDSRIVLSGVFNKFLDEFAFLKTWLILLLICAIALILLGH